MLTFLAFAFLLFFLRKWHPWLLVYLWAVGIQCIYCWSSVLVNNRRSQQGDACRLFYSALLGKVADHAPLSQIPRVSLKNVFIVYFLNVTGFGNKLFLVVIFEKASSAPFLPQTKQWNITKCRRHLYVLFKYSTLFILNNWKLLLSVKGFLVLEGGYLGERV